MGTTVAGVLAGETPYMPHLYKRNEIGVIISYALITLSRLVQKLLRHMHFNMLSLT